jgi:hypothetical protein
MTTIHAYVFLPLGGVLNLLPLLALAQFPPNSLDGSSTSALWLQLMGWVNGGLGAGYVARLQVLPVIGQALAWRPVPLPEFVPAEMLRPALSLDHGDYSDGDGEQSVAA